MTARKTALTKADADLPYLTESSEFVVIISQHRQHAQRMVEDLDGEIAELEAQIQARLSRRHDLSNIIARADAALGLDVPNVGAINSPHFTETPPDEDN